MKTIKALIVVWVLFAVLPPVPCASMQILRETYHAWDQVGWSVPEGQVPTYDVIRSRPSAFGESAGGGGYWQSLATRYSEDGSTFFHAEQHGSCGICQWWLPLVSAYATVVVDFTGMGTAYIEAWRGVEYYGWAEATLTDLTNGGSWVLLEPGPTVGESQWWQVPVEMHSSMWFPFDSDAVYRLELSAYPTEYHSSDVTVKFSGVSSVIVPVPGALLLAVVGVGLLGWMRPKDDRWR